MLFSRPSNGRLTPMNLSRPSSSATAKAPEANLGAREEGGSMQASLHRGILRTHARHSCRVTAQNEESRFGNAKVVRHASGKPSEQWYNCSVRGKADASGDDVFHGCLWGIASVGPDVWVARTTDTFWIWKRCSVEHSKSQTFAAAALIATENQRVKAARLSGTTANTSLRARWQ